MCDKIVKGAADGYVMRCRRCDRVQVGFMNIVLSFTVQGFYDFLQEVDEQYKQHNLCVFKERKMIVMPTVTASVSMCFSLSEVDELLHMLIEGRNKMEYEQLFVFSNN